MNISVKKMNLRKCSKELLNLRCVVVTECQRSIHYPRKRLVILGTGWGSYSVLKHVDRKWYDTIVISPRNHFLFTPLLCSTTVGTLEFRSIIEPVRNVGFRKSDHFHLSNATSIDFKKQIVHVESVLKPDSNYDLSYDKLVIGVGALSNTFNTPGVYENAYFLKEVCDARKIRNKILSNFELATQPSSTPEEAQRLLHIVIVGGGPTGVEFGAEIYDFVEQDIRRIYKEYKVHVRVTLVESNQILSAFEEGLRKYAEKKIVNRAGFSIKRDVVTAVHKDHVVLASGEKISCGLVLWSTGLAPREFVKQLDIPKNNRGQILTDSYLSIVGDPSGNSYALGDCADIQDDPLPCTAQVAERQGRFLADLLVTGRKGPFNFKSAGIMAYVGNYEGLTDLPKKKIKGLPSWFLWRSAYLTKLGSWRLRMQVPIDWTKTLLFGRDVSRFD